MASSSLHGSSSVTETPEANLPLTENLQRQAKSHFTVRVGQTKPYADSDFVKPHGSHAHLNLSHVLVADQPQPDSDSTSSDSKTQASLSETVVHQRSLVSSSSSSSGGEEETASTSDTLNFVKDDQGDKAISFEPSNTDAINDSTSGSSINSNTAILDSESWSSISTLNEEAPTVQDVQEEVSRPAEVQAPPRNLLDMLKGKGFSFARRDAVSNEVNQMSVIEKFRQGIAAKKQAADQSQGGEVDDRHLDEELDADEDDDDDDDSVVSDVEESTGRLADEDSEDLAEKESLAKPQHDPSSSESLNDLIKDAMAESGMNNADLALSVQQTSTPKSTESDTKISGSTELHGGDSTKSFDTAISEFETLEMEGDDYDMESATSHLADSPRDANGTDGMEGQDVSSSSSATIELPGISLNNTMTSSVDTVIHKDLSTVLQQQDDIVTESERQVNPADQRGEDMILSVGSRLHGHSRSESSVEVIPDIKKDSGSSLDGLAIAEERESNESNLIKDMIHVKETSSGALVQHLQSDLKSTQEELTKVRQQLDVQLMCEDVLRKEAEDEIMKGVRKISRLQAQLSKPPKLINKHRKELRRIFQEIESEGGPRKVWTSVANLQLAIRFLYWKQKDTEKCVRDTEQQMQDVQQECMIWKTRANEQEAAKDQLMVELEEQKIGMTGQIGNSTFSQSDTRLSYSSTDQRSVPGDIHVPVSWGLQDHTPSQLTFINRMKSLKHENTHIRQQLMDIKNQYQQQRLEVNDAKSSADGMKSKLNVLNDELIVERLHSQHLSTKLHCHEVNTKNSMLWGMADKLSVTTPPVDEAITTRATMEDIEGLEDWLGHLKAGQQHTMTELDRHKDTLESLQSDVSEMTSGQLHHKTHQEFTDRMTHLVNSGSQLLEEIQNKYNQVVDNDGNGQQQQDKLWQELRQLRDVQLETITDLEDKDSKINELQHRYSELVAEQLHQRTKLEMDLTEYGTEKQEIQNQLEETQQLVSELHRKCVQLSQALEEAQGALAKQEQTIKSLTEQYELAMTNKDENLEAKQASDARQSEDMEKRVALLEAKVRESMSSEVKLREQLESCVEKNELMLRQKSDSAKLDDKLSIIERELELIRDSELHFHSKYASQDKEIHHLHHNVSSMQTAIKQQVDQAVKSALSGWKQQKEMLQSQLTEALTAHTSSEQSRKVTENINKVLIKKAAQLEANCSALTHQLEQQWVDHQKAAERIQHVQSVIGEEKHASVPVQVNNHEHNGDLEDWEHQLKEEANRLSTQLHRIMGNHDNHVRQTNVQLPANINIPQHSCHDSVNSARTKLQVLLKSVRPNSAMPYISHGNRQPYEGTLTQARRLQTTSDDSRTMSGSPLGVGQRHIHYSPYAESYSSHGARY